jgi:ABC-2 type transport system permease protein
MKLALLRRSSGGPRAAYAVTGALLGVAGALGTIALATLDASRPAAVLDLLAAVFAIWALGWMLAPAYGGAPLLRPEQFALEPIPRRRLAAGLLAAGLAGVPAAVTLLAFLAAAVLAIRLDAAALVVAVPGSVLLLVLVVLLSRLSAHLFGALARSRAGGAVSALINALLLVGASSGWIVFAGLDAVLASGFSDGVSAAVRALPSSWGLLAVEAAGRGDWTAAALLLLGLLVLVVLLLVAWSALFGPPRLARPAVRGSPAGRAAPRGRLGAGATQAVFVKELRSWWRDPVRLQGVVLAPAFAVLTCLVPLAFGSAGFLPFVGALAALMGAVTASNGYGQDGTALWLTLLAPSSERADVRGRQLAWLVVFAPLTAVLTAVGIAVSGEPELAPWAAAASLALLGGGAGLLPLVAVELLVPGPDPREHKDSPLDHGDVTGQAFAMLFLALACALPAVGVVALVEAGEGGALAWLGVPAALLTGVLAYAFLGSSAAASLARRGPELLHLMRAGRPQGAPPGGAAAALEAMPASRRRLLSASVLVGCIALFPQALVPAAMKLADDSARVWFLALYVPEPWQWPVIALMALLGAGAFLFAWRLLGWRA